MEEIAPAVRIKRVRPKTYAQKCPVCRGSGHKYMEPNVVCNGCLGRGWILVPVELPNEFTS